MQYFTADSHFYGERILIREKRPFSSPEDFVISEVDKWKGCSTSGWLIRERWSKNDN